MNSAFSQTPPFPVNPCINTPFFGHDELVAKLQGMLLQQGAVLIEGAAGVGKTALACHLATWLKNQGYPNVCWHSCVFDTRELYLDTHELNLIETVASWLWHNGDPEVWDTQTQFSFSANASFEPDQVMFHRIVEKLCCGTPFILIIDDIHIMTPKVRNKIKNFINTLVLKSIEGNFKLIVTSREAIPDFQISPIQLYGLDTTSATRFIREYNNQLDDHLIQKIYTATDGYPALIRQITSNLQSIDIDQLTSIHSIPRVEEYVVKRIYNHLSLRKNMIMHVSAVLKEHATREALAVLTNLPMDVIRDETRSLAEHALLTLRPARQTNTYEDTLISLSLSLECFYRSSASTNRQEIKNIHHNAAEFLKSRDILAAFNHFIDADEYEQAARLAVGFTGSWFQQYQMWKIIEQIDNTIIRSISDRRLQALINRRLGDLTYGKAAGARYNNALDVIQGMPEETRLAVELYERLAFSYVESARSTAMKELRKGKLLIKQLHEPYLDALVRNREATIIADKSERDLQRAIKLLRKAFAMLEKEQITREIQHLKAQVAFNLGSALRLHGSSEEQLEEAESYLDKGIAIRDYIGDKIGSVEPLTEKATLHWYRSADFEVAREIYNQALDRCREYGLLLQQADIITNIGITHYFEHAYSKTIDLFIGAFDIYKQENDNVGRAYILFYQALTEIDREDTRKAQHYRTELFHIVQDNADFSDYLLSVAQIDGALLRLKGEYEKAAEHLQNAWDQYSSEGKNDDKARLLEEQARVALCLPESVGEALDYANEAKAYAVESRARPLIHRMQALIDSIRE